MELLAIWLATALVVTAALVILRARATRWARIAVVGGMVIAGLIALARPRAAASKAGGPRVVHDDFIGSGACQPCHPSEHASWSRTYHRTMTQRASPPFALTTGSHHMMGFWEEDESGQLQMLPFVYARDEGRFIARRDAFLQPPDAPQHDVRWRSNCITCHTTSGRPAIDERRSIVAELGIACEACHGPGREHADRMRDPMARWRPHDLAIVNPARLAPERASAVCGACHAYAFPRDEEAFWKAGYASFRPGDALEPSRILLTPEVLASGKVSLDTDPRNLFWPDGTVRVGGREHNAMILSACYLRGEGERKITCMSCHSMHQSDPDDQLRRDRSVDASCGSCHTMKADHSHHPTPVSCVSCHMPKTSYALRYAIRSHRIDSPRTGSGKPTACNLCHLDRSEAWTATELAKLWGAAPEAGMHDDGPASVSGLLKADAAERVIWADAFGDRDAIAASGRDWQRTVLERATSDPYAVIRFIVQRSLEAYPPKARALALPTSLDELVSHRDDRPVSIAE